MSFYLGRNNVENVCNLYMIVVTIETGQGHHFLRLFVQRTAITENIPRSHMGLDHFRKLKPNSYRACSF